MVELLALLIAEFEIEILACSVVLHEAVNLLWLFSMLRFLIHTLNPNGFTLFQSLLLFIRKRGIFQGLRNINILQCHSLKAVGEFVKGNKRRHFFASGYGFKVKYPSAVPCLLELLFILIGKDNSHKRFFKIGLLLLGMGCDFDAAVRLLFQR